MTLSLFIFIVALIAFGSASTIALIGLVRGRGAGLVTAVGLVTLSVALVVVSAVLNKPVGTQVVRSAAGSVSHFASELKTPTSKETAYRVVEAGRALYTANNTDTFATVSSVTAPLGAYDFLFKINGYKAAACISYHIASGVWDSRTGTCSNAHQ